MTPLPEVDSVNLFCSVTYANDAYFRGGVVWNALQAFPNSAVYAKFRKLWRGNN